MSQGKLIMLLQAVWHLGSVYKVSINQKRWKVKDWKRDFIHVDYTTEHFVVKLQIVFDSIEFFASSDLSGIEYIIYE